MDGFTKQKKNSYSDRSNAEVWRKRIEQCDGFTDDAEGYIYVLELTRELKGSTYYYVGLSTVHPLKRISDHSKDMVGVSKPVEYEDGMDRMESGAGERYTLDSVERIESYIGFGSNLHAMLRDKEREMSYKIAIQYDTTNVLGGH